jgi:hypothetical protein
MLNTAQKSELKLKYGDLIVVKESEGEFVFKRPSPAAFGQFMAAQMSDSKKGGKVAAFEQLCHACLVYPEAAPEQPDYPRLMSLFERLPGLPVSVGGELCDLAGLGDSHVGKL